MKQFIIVGENIYGDFTAKYIIDYNYSIGKNISVNENIPEANYKRYLMMVRNYSVNKIVTLQTLADYANLVNNLDTWEYFAKQGVRMNYWNQTFPQQPKKITSIEFNEN